MSPPPTHQPRSHRPPAPQSPTPQPRVPQPHPSRITSFSGHPIVAGITATRPELVILTAADLARSTGATLYLAHADPARYTLEEYPDGTVRHAAIDPDLGDDDAWHAQEDELVARVRQVLGEEPGLDWQFRYLAGRPDRALTHLARAVDAAAIVVGSQTGRGSGLHELLRGAVGRHLAHHQHRPVLVVPLAVVDWKDPLP